MALPLDQGQPSDFSYPGLGELKLQPVSQTMKANMLGVQVSKAPK
jgi:hypothetical protein